LIDSYLLKFLNVQKVELTCSWNLECSWSKN